MKSVSSESWKRLIIRWTAPKGFVALIMFSLLVVLTEYAAVLLSLSFGLTDQNVLSGTFQFPGTTWTFTITISPLFHLIPLGVILVLISSWVYLTQYVAVRPRRVEPVRKKFLLKKPRKRRAPKSFRRFWKRISRSFTAFYRWVRDTFMGIRGVSQLWQKLFFAKAAVKSAVSILVVFTLLVLLIYAIAYPTLIHNSVVGFYNWNSACLGVVATTINAAHSLAEALGPIGGIASAFDGALKSLAPGFRSSLDSLGSVVAPLVELDAVGKYVVCQNLAAWISALLVMVYGRFVVKPYRRRG